MCEGAQTNTFNRKDTQRYLWPVALTLPFANISTCSCISTGLWNTSKCQIKIDTNRRTYHWTVYRWTLFTDISYITMYHHCTKLFEISLALYRDTTIAGNVEDKMQDSLSRGTISSAIHPLKSSVVRFFVGASRPLNFLSEITYRWEGILISQHDGRRYQPFANGCLLAYDNTAWATHSQGRPQGA